MARSDGAKKQSASSPMKFPQALMPNSRLFLIFLILFAVATFVFSDRLWLALTEVGIILALIVYSLIANRAHRKALRST